MLTALVTGANSGIGFETSRMLADEESVSRIVLACRSEDKAQAAIKRLVQTTGRPPSTFSTVPLDTSSLNSVNTAVGLTAGPIDMMVLNSGGMGSDDHLKLTSDGITKVMAINTTGHAAFFEGLLAGKKLAKDAKVIFTSSEIARGMTGMARKPSFTSHDAECITTHIVGKPACSYARTPSFMSVMSSYAAAKAIGTLYFQQCARENPTMTIYSVSPGSCYGTNAHLNAPGKMQMTNVPLQMRLMSFLGLAQSSAVGAKRNLDALFGRGLGYPSGTFIASRGWATGATCDQAANHADIFANETLQLSAAQAVRKAIA